MDVEYFRVRETKNPEQNGIVLQLQESKLETFAGDPSPSQFGCSLDSEGNLSVGRGYFLESITQNEAEKLREDYLSYKRRGD